MKLQAMEPQADESTFVEEEMLEWLFATPGSISSSSSSSGSSDENVKIRIPKVDNFVEEVVPSYSDDTFKQHFRLSRPTVYMLIDRFNNSVYNVKATNNMGTTAEKSLLLCLWYLANSESFRQIADRFSVSLSSAHRLLVRVIDFIVSLREEFIKWPDNEQKKKISNQFRKKQGFKGVIGCIDGSHIRIHRHIKDEEVYVNRKGYHSLLIQGLCDHQKLFLDMYCGEPGSIHDARLLRKSSIYRRAETANTFDDYYLLGDSAYPSLSWLVPPFKDNGRLTQEHKQFNFKLSSTRVIIEHAFGLLKGRFRRLLLGFENLSIDLIVKCIMAACVLHNIGILQSDLLDETEQVYHDDLEFSDKNPGSSSEFEMAQEKGRREAIFRKMFDL